MEKAYLARNQIDLIKGKYDDSNLQYVTSQMKCKEGVRYVEIQMAGCDEMCIRDRCKHSLLGQAALKSVKSCMFAQITALKQIL